MSNSASRFVSLKAMADGSLLRLATLHDKEYLVVPIVSAVGDQVWWPANSDVPELVPADVLESAFWSRNNRPIVAGHPRVNGEYVSANSPEILEKYSFGHLFAAKFDDKRVKVEAWFDKTRANEVGPAAIDVINRLESGEQIEVSEGNMVISEAKEGELDGKPYKSIWISCVNDHLATVLEGACNNKMGCGGPRVNQTKLEVGMKADPGKGKFKDPFRIEGSEKKSGMLQRMLASMSNSLKAAMSGNELRMRLFKALSEAQPGVSYVYDEDTETKQVIYCVVVSYGDYWDAESEYHFYRRSFNMTPEGVVSVNDDAIEVEWFEGWKDAPVTTTETIAGITAATTTTATLEVSDSTCSCKKEDDVLKTNEKKTLVTKLIGAAKSPFDEADRVMLGGMADEKLTSLMSAYEGEIVNTPTPVAVVPPPNVETTTTNTTTTTDQVVLSKEEYEEIKASSNAHKAQQLAYRTSLVSSLKGAQSAFTEKDMEGMTTVQLEKLAISLGVNEPVVADYSVRGISRPVVTEKKDHTPPKSWDLAMAARNERKSAAN